MPATGPPDDVRAPAHRARTLVPRPAGGREARWRRSFGLSGGAHLGLFLLLVGVVVVRGAGPAVSSSAQARVSFAPGETPLPRLDEEPPPERLPDVEPEPLPEPAEAWTEPDLARPFPGEEPALEPVELNPRLPLGGPLATARPAPRPEAAVPEPPPAPVEAVETVAAEVAPAVPPGEDREPLLLEAPGPAYPPVAYRRGWEGAVLCRIRVAADGSVAAVEVARSSGHEVLDRAVAEAVKEWRFRPGLRAGRAAPLEVVHRIVFRIEASTP